MLVAVNNEPPPPPVAAEVQPVVGGVQHRLSQPVPAGCQRLALLTRKNLCELFLSEAAMARLLPLEARLRGAPCRSCRRCRRSGRSCRFSGIAAIPVWGDGFFFEWMPVFWGGMHVGKGCEASAGATSR